MTKKLTVGDIEYFEEVTQSAFSAFNPETQAMGKPMAVLAGISLYHQGKAASREEGREQAREMEMAEAVALMEEMLEDLGE